MAVVGTANLVMALVIFFRSRKWGVAEPHNSGYFRLLRILGLIFISVALYRTIFVSSYPDRLVWYDTVFNSPFLIRCLAAFAELSFIIMIAAVMRKMIKDIVMSDERVNGNLPRSVLDKLPLVAVGCIFLAQLFAFAGLITQYQTPFAIEETLWALAFLSITPMIVTGFKQVKKNKNAAKGFKAFLIVMAVWCGGYLAFQCLYALPFMYFANLAQDAGKSIPRDALRQAVFGYTATRDFSTWGGLGFFIWHSGYFSVCAWMTLLFMSAPRKQNAMSE